MSTVCIEAPWVDPFLIVAMENVPAPFTSTDELICGWFSHNGADWTGRRVLSWAWEKHVLNVHERESLVVVGLWLMVSGCLTRLIYHAPTEQASKLSADSEPGQNAGAFVPRKKNYPSSLIQTIKDAQCTLGITDIPSCFQEKKCKLPRDPPLRPVCHPNMPFLFILFRLSVWEDRNITLALALLRNRQSLWQHW